MKDEPVINPRLIVRLLFEEMVSANPNFAERLNKPEIRQNPSEVINILRTLIRNHSPRKPQTKFDLLSNMPLLIDAALSNDPEAVRAVQEYWKSITSNQ